MVRVLVTGASGYLGGAVVAALRAEGQEVRALVRRSVGLPAHLGGVETARGDAVSGEGLAEAARGCQAVIHLVGIIRESAGVTMERVHVGGTRNVLRAAEAAGVEHFVHVSAVGADAHGATPYQRSKGEAERLVAAAGMAHTIIRPTVVFGPGGPGHNLVSELGGILRRAPVMPVFGDGRYPMQPVSAANVATGCARALSRPAARGRTFEAGGPERLSYEEVLRRIASALHRPFRPVHVPLGVIRPALPLLEHLPGFPLTSDQLTMLLAGNACDPQPFLQAFAIRPDRFEGR